MTAAAPINVLYFAWLRERVGISSESIALPDGVATVATLIDWLAASSPRHAAAFVHRATLRCAINQEFASPDASVAAGDEVAFFPPVTGG